MPFPTGFDRSYLVILQCHACRSRGTALEPVPAGYLGVVYGNTEVEAANDIDQEEAMSYVGQPMKRFEDPRLVTGNGTFVGDLTLPDMRSL
jgi:hypothetical protein